MPRPPRIPPKDETARKIVELMDSRVGVQTKLAAAIGKGQYMFSDLKRGK